ncbi:MULTISPECIES: hypothetical protein [Sorangium]|uniref:Uncharacterized protein n=1 Tax=Sorangium cellulosum TaxID=56 RepID=A0A4P2R1E1_SORCE|nr:MULTISPECIES: hypothetical protein [Sorangium]AUX35743.1 hypothetical protein SOCE836_079410 [Sorangium cellulosum]WCQ95043.1 hypothetical protein NQZ70_07818 [Sorangium sp. Soce836]
MGSAWTWLLERCAEIVGVTDGAAGPADDAARRRRRRTLVLLLSLLVGASCLLGERWGAKGLLPAVALFLLAVQATRAVLAARASVWRAAALDLEDPAQRPSERADPWFAPPTARVLCALAAVIDAARRERYAIALERLPHVDRAALRPDEVRLLDAARALLSLGLGDPARAAQQAIVALPTGIDAIDARLGRVVLADAWKSPARIEAIERAWRSELQSGVTSEALERLLSLSRLRFAPQALEALKPAEARELSAEAWSIGEEELAAALEARARGGVYR